VGQQLVCGQIVRLAPVEDCLDDVRGEIAEADQPCEVGRADAFPLGQCGKWQAVAAEECGSEPVRLDQQLNEPGIGFRCGKRVVRSMSILSSRPERRSPTGTDRI